MNLVFLVFVVLVFGVPAYERYERRHHPDNPVPTQVKWTAQIALGSAAAAYSVCRIVTQVRGSNPNTVAGSFYCSSLGVAGGAMSGGVMSRKWEEGEWAYYREVIERFGVGSGNNSTVVKDGERGNVRPKGSQEGTGTETKEL
ncbi:hypothetical protein N0V82_009424 [Gnomoniopsis sp. IMI 355080]|nr:hypothetical protein N0V82_009424 [Gnomoniopsis sp. IMI 355080]